MLTFENGVIRLGDRILPGVLKSLSVRGQVKYDETTMDARSGQARIPAGWEDADISATVELLTDTTTCYAKLRELNGIFKSAETVRDTDHGQTITRPPAVYAVVNEHINARGIRKVVFSGLASSETDDDDVIQAVLTFSEYDNPAAAAETRAQGTESPSTSDPTAAGNAITNDDEILTGKI